MQHLLLFCHFFAAEYHIYGVIMQKPYIPAERRKKIQEHLITNKVANLADLRVILNTTTATVRRDLEKLEKTGFLANDYPKNQNINKDYWITLIQSI